MDTRLVLKSLKGLRVSGPEANLVNLEIDEKLPPVINTHELQHTRKHSLFVPLLSEKGPNENMLKKKYPKIAQVKVRIWP